jgi:hypothetical protein
LASQQNQRFGGKIPYDGEQGFFWREQGIPPTHQGIFWPQPGRRSYDPNNTWSHRSQKFPSQRKKREFLTFFPYLFYEVTKILSKYKYF